MIPSLSFLFVKNYPKAWKDFWEPIYSLSRNLGVDVSSALEIFKLVYECVSKEEERRPVSTGFLIGDAKILGESLPDSVGITVKREKIVAAEKTIRSLFGLIDGFRSTFIIGKEGTLEYARLMPAVIKLPCENSFTADEMYGYCDVLKGKPGYGLVSLGSLKTVKLFTNGALHSEVYFSGKVGEWTYRPLDKSVKVMNQLASERNIDRKILHKLLSTTIRMSNYRKGGTIIIGDHKEVLKQSDAPRFKLSGINIIDLKGRQEKHLFNLATQEFALILSNDGAPQASSVRLLARVPDEYKDKIELTPMDGGRHRSAAEISASTDCIAFVVSDDGPITIYSKGRILLKL
jgi:hypothetical protein